MLKREENTNRQEVLYPRGPGVMMDLSRSQCHIYSHSGVITHQTSILYHNFVHLTRTPFQGILESKLRTRMLFDWHKNRANRIG